MSIGQKAFYPDPLKSEMPSPGKHLWKKIRESPQVQQKDAQSTMDKILVPHPSNLKSQVRINDFLQKLHHKISESLNVSESEIVEKRSIDWEDDLGNEHIFKLNIKHSASKDGHFIYSPRVKKCNCQLLDLSDIQSLDYLIEIFQLKNVRLYRQLNKLILSKEKMEIQNSNLKCQNLKNEEKILQLNNCIMNLQNMNNKLNQDLKKLKSEVEIQINLEQQRIKYKYEKIIQQLKQQTEKKLSLLNTSQTINSSFNTSQVCIINLSGKLKEICKEKSKQNAQSETSRIQKNSKSSPKSKKLSRSNKKPTRQLTPSSYSKSTTESDLKQKQRNQQQVNKNKKEGWRQKSRYIPSTEFKKHIQNFDNLLNTIIKQERKDIKNYRFTSK